MRRHPEIENLYCIFKDKVFELFVDIELYMPWNSEEDTPKPPEPEPLPKPDLRNWSVTIQVLADIKERSEFEDALTDYHQARRLSIATDVNQLPGNNSIYVALLAEKNLAALLHYDGSKYIDVRTCREYEDYMDAFKGEVMVIWIGEPKE